MSRVLMRFALNEAARYTLPRQEIRLSCLSGGAGMAHARADVPDETKELLMTGLKTFSIALLATLALISGCDRKEGTGGAPGGGAPGAGTTTPSTPPAAPAPETPASPAMPASPAS
jgi:hypothetical protein